MASPISSNELREHCHAQSSNCHLDCSSASPVLTQQFKFITTVKQKQRLATSNSKSSRALCVTESQSQSRKSNLVFDLIPTDPLNHHCNPLEIAAMKSLEASTHEEVRIKSSLSGLASKRGVNNFGVRLEYTDHPSPCRAEEIFESQNIPHHASHQGMGGNTRSPAHALDPKGEAGHITDSSRLPGQEKTSGDVMGREQRAAEDSKNIFDIQKELLDRLQQRSPPSKFGKLLKAEQNSVLSKYWDKGD